MQTPREITLKLLVSTERNQSYSNIVLDQTLSKYTLLKDVDRRFITALYYGVIERKITLDAVILAYSTRPLSKLSDAVRTILRMGIYQILYMDSVPDSAAVNESVLLAKDNKNPGTAGFINALLRSFIRDGKKLPQSTNKVKNLSIEYSCPEWLIKMWTSDYGEETALSMLRSSVGKPPLTIRLNTALFTVDEIKAELENEGASISFYDIPIGCAELFGCGSCEKLSAYKKGMFHVQDVSCQICAGYAAAKPGEIALDMCSAPGGKAFTMAEIMENKGKVIALDLHDNRVRLIKSGAKRLGLDIIEARTNNAKVISKDIPQADSVLCDVPCSGLGVIRRKPEIKYCDRSAIAGLPEVQHDILSASAEYVKPGGTLVYSTCTLNRAENDDQAERFLAENKDFEPYVIEEYGSYKVTLTPELSRGDGFFIARFRRRM